MSELFWCICGALFSLVISGFFFFVGKKRKRISQDIKTFSLISNKVSKIEGLEVKYHSKDIANLFSSIITIRNIGNSTIENFDFAPSSPLSISTTGEFLISKPKEKDLSSTNNPNNARLIYKLNDQNMCDYITIAFDYISKKEQLTISIFHTGEISVGGVLKDGQILDQHTITKRRKFLIDAASYFIGGLISCLSIALIIFFTYLIVK